MQGITTTPRSVSMEDALRNLARVLTGKPVAGMPATLEGVLQFMAENVAPAGAADQGDQTEAVSAAVAEKLKADDSFITAVAEKLKADDSFITDLAEKVAAKSAVPGGAPGMEGPSVINMDALGEAVTQEVLARLNTASVTANKAPSAGEVPEATPEPEAATATARAATAGSNRKATKTTN